MKISKEIKTALLALSGIALFYWGFSFLKGRDLFSNSRIFHVVYNDVAGLTPGTAVTINGLASGKIASIKFMGDRGKLLVTLNITNGFEFSRNSEAVIYESSFIGGKALALQIANDDAPKAKSGDTLLAGYRAGLAESLESKLVPLQGKFENMILTADSVLTNINRLLAKENRENFGKALEDLSQTIANFNGMSKNLNGMVKDNRSAIDSSLAHIAAVTANIEIMTDSLSRIRFKETMDNLNTTVSSLQSVLKNVEQGEGTFGKLMYDNALYDNLTSAAKELDLLLADLKENPKRYTHFSLFGKRPKPYERPVEEEGQIQEEKQGP